MPKSEINFLLKLSLTNHKYDAYFKDKADLTTSDVLEYISDVYRYIRTSEYLKYKYFIENDEISITLNHQEDAAAFINSCICYLKGGEK